LYVALNNATADLAQYQFDNSAELLNEGKAHERATLMITLAVTVAGFISAAVMWITLTHAISKPLAAATRHFKAIESGDLTSHITIERADELGSLLQSLATMQEGLRQTVSTIRQGVDLVVDAADEVATGNADLSGRTERQAASLEETAANMEELSATVKHNTSHALEASTLARSVGETASQGAEALQRVLDTMNLLKQGSGKIADITSVIEGIAFQTNILALNAAVEAARAGETGRGFAVVASEVRALAQRSGSAAKEIKDLLDASVSSVRDGATQATEAGGRMNATLDALQRVTSLINEVADASQEQARSVEQVTTAISQMDEVTQQNAALVEQAATASDSMREQATTIRTVVARFRTTKSHASTGSHDASMQTHASTGSYASISKHA
jgi:methyl-accepting chemotaxis protein-1 (serine sensor receptor)